MLKTCACYLVNYPSMHKVTGGQVTIDSDQNKQLIAIIYGILFQFSIDS
jgi:hypothetical protein